MSAGVNGRPSVLRSAPDAPDQHISSEGKQKYSSQQRHALRERVQTRMAGDIKPHPQPDSERHHTHESEGKAHGPTS